MWRNSTLAFLLQEKTIQVLLPTSIPKEHCIWTTILPRGLARKKLIGCISMRQKEEISATFFFPLSTFTRCIWRLHWDVSRFERESGKGIAERDMMKRTIYLFSFCWPNIFYLCDTHFFLVSLNTFPEKSPHREAICHHFLYLGHGTWFQASATEDPGAVSVHVTW